MIGNRTDNHKPGTKPAISAAGWRASLCAMCVGALLGNPLAAAGAGPWALQFDGVQDEVISFENFDVGSQITVEAWVNIESVTISPCCTFGGLVTWGSGSNASWETVIVGEPWGGPLEAVSPGIKFNWNMAEPATAVGSAGTFPLQQWTHLAMTYDGSAARTYINGELERVLELNVDIEPATPGAWLSIGNNFPGADEFIGGMVDEVRIWSVARTQAQIHMMMHRQLTGDEDGLFAYYPFSEGEGQIVFDHSGNERHALLGGSDVPNEQSPTWMASTAPICVVNPEADITLNGNVGVPDLLILLAAWGPCQTETCLADLNDDGVVDVDDLLILLGAWGPCP